MGGGVEVYVEAVVGRLSLKAGLGRLSEEGYADCGYGGVNEERIASGSGGTGGISSSREVKYEPAEVAGVDGVRGSLKIDPAIDAVPPECL